MITALLLAGAALLFANPEHLRAIRETLRQKAAAAAIKPRQMIAVGLVIGAALVWYAGLRDQAAPPAPAPAPAGLHLRGLFRGPTAAEDAATIGGLCSELADEIEWDGRQAEPFLKSGVSFDELRQRARELRCRGVSIGARQPAARDAIKVYLEQEVGTAGGPVTTEQRAKWVAALREIGREATHAAR
jgi:hypothetical protein